MLIKVRRPTHRGWSHSLAGTLNYANEDKELNSRKLPFMLLFLPGIGRDWLLPWLPHHGSVPLNSESEETFPSSISGFFSGQFITTTVKEPQIYSVSTSPSVFTLSVSVSLYLESLVYLDYLLGAVIWVGTPNVTIKLGLNAQCHELHLFAPGPPLSLFLPSLGLRIITLHRPFSLLVSKFWVIL